MKIHQVLRYYFISTLIRKRFVDYHYCCLSLLLKVMLMFGVYQFRLQLGIKVCIY